MLSQHAQHCRKPVRLLNLPRKRRLNLPHAQEEKISRTRPGARSVLAERQSMKLLHYVTVKLVMIAIACSFAASTTAQAGDASTRAATTETARLVVNRAADFGTEQSVHLFVDGVEVTDIGYNTSYESALSPGEHVLAISTSPNPYGDKTTQQRVNARPGQTYAFIAVWDDPEHASLEPSPGA